MKTQQLPLLHAVGEVGLIYTKNKVILPFSKVKSSDDAYNAFKEIFDPDTISHREFMYGLYLSRGNRILGYAQISTGGLASTSCDPKVVLQYALKLNASAIILAHNHPSGSLRPSDADIKLTTSMKRAAEILDINLLDHLIITDTYYSTTLID